MMKASTELRWIVGGTLLLAVIGAMLRIWHVGTTPMWLDEAYSAYAAHRNFAFLWQVVPRYETHPPFYYSLLRLWTYLFGESLLAERGLGLAAGLATPLVLGWTAATLGAWLGWDVRHRRLLAFATFALACIAIPLVEMSREVRPYPLMILVYALATRAVIGIGRDRARGLPLPGPNYTLYLVCLGLMLWLHNLGPFWAAAMGLAFLAAALTRPFRPADLGWLVAGHAAVILFYLPALAILIDQAPTWVHSTWLQWSAAGAAEHLPVLYGVPGWQGIAALILALLAIAALVRAPRPLAILLLLALVPSLLSILVSITIAPVFITRTLTPVAAPTLLLLAVGAVAWGRPTGWIGAGAALMLGANMLAVDIQTRAGPPMQDWYGAVAWLHQRFRPGDLVLAYPNEGALPLERAMHDRGLSWPIEPVPVPVPALDQGGWNPTGSRGVVSLPRPRLEAIARRPDIAGPRRVWLLRLGAPTYDPGDMFLTALRRQRRVIARRVDGPIDLIGLERR